MKASSGQAKSPPVLILSLVLKEAYESHWELNTNLLSSDLYKM